MSKKDLGRVWSFVGFVAFSVTSLVFLRTTGLVTSAVLGIESGPIGSYSIAILGIVVGCALLTILVRLGSYEIRRRPADNWASRLPDAFGVEIVASDRLGREYQLAVLLAFIVYPLLAQMLFLAKLFQATVYRACLKVGDPPLCHFAWSSLRDLVSGVYHLETHTGVAYYPLVEPMLFLVAEIVLFTAAVRFLRNLFFPSPARSAGPPQTSDVGDRRSGGGEDGGET